MREKKVKFPNGKVYTYYKYNTSDYWERTVGPSDKRRKVRLHQDIATNGKGETLQGSGYDVHHKNGNKGINTKNNMKKMKHEKHTGLGNKENPKRKKNE